MIETLYHTYIRIMTPQKTLVMQGLQRLLIDRFYTDVTTDNGHFLRALVDSGCIACTVRETADTKHSVYFSLQSCSLSTLLQVLFQTKISHIFYLIKSLLRQLLDGHLGMIIVGVFREADLPEEGRWPVVYPQNWEEISWNFVIVREVTLSHLLPYTLHQVMALW